MLINEQNAMNKSESLLTMCFSNLATMKFFFYFYKLTCSSVLFTLELD